MVVRKSGSSKLLNNSLKYKPSQISVAESVIDSKNGARNDASKRGRTSNAGARVSKPTEEQSPVQV